MLFLTNNLVRNQEFLTFRYISQLRFYLFLFFYFLMWFKLRIFYHHHYVHIFYKLLYKYKIFCVRHTKFFNEIYFFPCILESSCFLLIRLNPHETQIHSYSYGRRVLRWQWPQCLPQFWIISFSVNSIENLL